MDRSTAAPRQTGYNLGTWITVAVVLIIVCLAAWLGTRPDAPSEPALAPPAVTTESSVNGNQVLREAIDAMRECYTIDKDVSKRFADQSDKSLNAPSPTTVTETDKALRDLIASVPGVGLIQDADSPESFRRAVATGTSLAPLEGRIYVLSLHTLVTERDAEEFMLLVEKCRDASSIILDLRHLTDMSLGGLYTLLEATTHEGAGCTVQWKHDCLSVWLNLGDRTIQVHSAASDSAWLTGLVTSRHKSKVDANTPLIVVAGSEQPIKPGAVVSIMRYRRHNLVLVGGELPSQLIVYRTTKLHAGRSLRVARLCVSDLHPASRGKTLTPDLAVAPSSLRLDGPEIRQALEMAKHR